MTPRLSGSGELLGQRDDDAFGAAEVAHEVGVAVVDDLADECGAVGAEPLDGVHEVVDLGYGDSGTDGRARGLRDRFTDIPIDAAARRLAAVLQSENADAFTIYDRHGGYGHPDHVRVHDVGVRAAQLAATPVVLEATADRARIQRALRLARLVPRRPQGFDPTAFASRYLPIEEVTHQVDVRDHLGAKRAAMAAHLSQHQADAEARTLRLFLRLPQPLFRAVFGYEWFRERGRTPAENKVDDVFASLC